MWELSVSNCERPQFRYLLVPSPPMNMRQPYYSIFANQRRLATRFAKSQQQGRADMTSTVALVQVSTCERCANYATELSISLKSLLIVLEGVATAC